MSKHQTEISRRIFIISFFTMLTAVAATTGLQEFTDLTWYINGLVGLVIGAVIGMVGSHISASRLSAPFISLVKKIAHVSSPEPLNIEGVQTEELIQQTVSLVGAQLAQTHEQHSKTNDSAKQIAKALNVLPYPVVGLNHKQEIALANHAFAQLVKAESPKELLGQEFLHVIQLFDKQDEPFVRNWIQVQQASSINAQHQWNEIQ